MTTKLVGHSQKEAQDKRARSDARRALALVAAKVADQDALTASSLPSDFPTGVSYVGDATLADGWPADGIVLTMKGDGGAAQIFHDMAGGMQSRSQDAALDSWTAWAAR